jgi:lysophospholipase L1-like esterase
VLARELGQSVSVVEEGLPGRTAAVVDPVWPHLAAVPYLQPALESHAPLDAVVIMLGTNDVQERYGRSAAAVAGDIAGLAGIAAASACGVGGQAPFLLLVAPPPLGPQADAFAEATYGSGAEASRQLGPLLAAAAERVPFACGFLDAGAVAALGETDGIHLDAAAHDALGRAVAEALRPVLVQRG